MNYANLFSLSLPAAINMVAVHQMSDIVEVSISVTQRPQQTRWWICISVGFHESFVEIYSYESSLMSDSNLESNLERFTSL